jgi:hypothetical protein
MRQLKSEEVERQDWCFPGFGVPKANGQIVFVIDFQNLYHQLERQEYPLTPVEEIFQSVGSFVHAASINLNMGYLHINLAQYARNILTVALSFGSYECTKLPMVVMLATDIFQSRMVSVFADMGPDKPIPYTNDILIFAGKTFEEHLAILELVGGFVHAASINLNMGHLHINLAQYARNILTVALSFGFYKCTKLPIVVMLATDIFQSRMVSVFADMGPDKPIPYINDILIFAGNTFEEHLAILDQNF